MANIKIEGMDEWLECLIATERQTANICGRSIYPGAKIVANTCKEIMEKLPTDDMLFRMSEKYGALREGLTKRQMRQLIASMGIASMQYSKGEYHVKLGFDGYNDIKSERWPEGQPNMMLARALNRGTSFLRAHPFMDQTETRSKGKAEKAIEEQFYNELDKFWAKQYPQFVTKDSLWK